MDPEVLERKQKHVAEEYLSSLSDLQCNSKPLINVLTMLAEENIEHAPIIVKVVEQHIAKVPTDLKLPILYLIDSIVKNVKSAYVALFGQCIVNIFCDVFEKVNEKIRERMYALRQTWSEVFPASKLYTLDVRVKQMDKNWPITAAKPQPAIHVNPNFLKSVPPDEINDVLKTKTRELLELRKRKLELELEVTKKHLEEQEKNVATTEPTEKNAIDSTLLPSTSSHMLTLPPTAENMPPEMYNQNFVRPPVRMVLPPGQQNAMPIIGAQLLPGSGVIHANANKIKVHPVNPALLNSIRQRDPRIMRQQLQQQQQQQRQPTTMRPVSGAEASVQSHSRRATSPHRNEIGKRDKRDGFRSSKTNSHESVDNKKSPTRHTSSSSRSSQRSSKSSSRDKERKRGESKSYNNPSSSERRHHSKGSTSSGSRQSRSDKESSDTASSPSSRHTKSPNSSPIKSSRRGSGSNKSSSVKNGQIRRSNSPKENIVSSTKEVDASNTATTVPVSLLLESSKKSVTMGTAAIKGLEQNIKRDFVETAVADEMLAATTTTTAKTTTITTSIGDVDLRQLIPNALLSTSIIPEPSVLNVSLTNPIVMPVKEKSLLLDNKVETAFNVDASSSSTKSPTTPNQPPKVSFKIQKLFNKLAKSTENPATLVTTMTSSPSSISTSSLSSALDSPSLKNKLEENHLDKNRTKTATTLESKEEAMEIDDVDERGKELCLKGNNNNGDGKKRATESGVNEEPLPKKRKSANMDALFGSEDVDLRTLAPPIIPTSTIDTTNEILVAPPPPNISSSDDDQKEERIKSRDNAQATKSSTNNGASQTSVNATTSTVESLPANFEDVRAKFAKATKIDRISKSSERNMEKARSKLAEINAHDDENTQEANDEKIRIILSQAQEMLESNSINKEQYKQLVQTVMSINEKTKLKEAKRRESLQHQKTPKKADDSIIEIDLDDDADTAVDVELMAARDAVLRKRIPKLSKKAVAAANAIEDLTQTKSPIAETEDARDDNITNLNRHKPKEKRARHSKWNERGGENQGNTSSAQRGWSGAGSKRNNMNVRSMGAVPPPPQPPNSIMPIIAPNQMRPMQGNWQNPANVGPMPFGANVSMPLRSTVPPPPQPPMTLPPVLPTLTPNGLPKPCNSIDNPQADLVRTITIDGQSKDIRIYDDVAIVFMNHDQPREIGFQPGQRAIVIDNQEPVTLRFNDEYKPIMIAGEMHRMRFGFPSRELYIDEHWYEIYFGGPPVSIPIKNTFHILKAEGPPPQVTIGPLRRDLVVGRIHMIVEAVNMFPLFLDARIQTFRYENVEHTVQFADNLLTVLLDGQPHEVEYGGLPKSFVLNGKRYFIRFTTLPKGVIAGKVEIKNMIYVKTEPPTTKNEQPIDENMIDKSNDDDTKTKTDDQAIAATTTAASSEEANKTSTTANILPATALGKINIDELFQKLVSTGILNNNITSVAATSAATAATTTAAANSATAKEDSKSANENIETKAATKDEEEVQNTEELPPIIPIDLSKPDSIKTRQEAIISTLYSGMQCSSCGVRFPPEQTIKYSQHLDWHFRQNRRERDSTRKAHSRKWYYELNDWLQYEEIEDLDEREKNFFETQQGELDALEDASNQRSTNSPQPTCAAGPDDVDRACDMCQEKFEQFYNEELEEWHLRMAVRIEDKIYHPLCYEDYKASLNPPTQTETPSKTNDEDVLMQEDDNAVDVVIKIEEEENGNETASNAVAPIPEDDDDDDVIVLPNEEPSVTEIVDDDDDEEYVPANVTREEMRNGQDEKVDESAMESDVEIQEPNIPFTDLDNYVEKELPDDEASQSSFRNVKIKEEPKDDDEDDGFEDVGTVMYGPHDEISIQSSEETQTQTILSSVDSPATLGGERSPTTAQTDAAAASSKPTPSSNIEEPVIDDVNNISMDGNLEPTDQHLNLSISGPPPAVPIGSLVNKIKINITKNTSTAANTASTEIATTTTTTSSNLSSNIGNNDAFNVNSNTHNISTIPVLCGGGTMAPSTSTSNTSSFSNSNVSNIQVIGSYNSYQNSQQQPKTTATTSTVVQRQRTPTPPPPVEETITYELKPALQKATLKKMKKVEAGVETSGLCSIM